MALPTLPRHRVALAATLFAACAGAPAPRRAEPWPAADALFARDPHWLGGDAVYSVDLGGDRILWLFGDSFVGLDGTRDRRTAAMVRNTIAVQRGRDPATAKLAFHWRTDVDGAAGAFFADDGPRGYWPLHGARVPGGPLLLFQTLVRNTPGDGLGFAIDGWRVVCVANPDDDPPQWRATTADVGATPAGVTFGAAVWRDREHLFVLGTRGHGPHRGALARLSLADLANVEGTAPRLAFEAWLGDRWAPLTATSEPAEVLADAGPECSVHADGDGWLHVWSRGFGATTVGAHTAADPRGPWSEPRDLFTPPESRAATPFVYAAKAHPDVDAGEGWLAISYATNTFAFGELFTPHGQQHRYWPRFWRVPHAALRRAPGRRAARLRAAGAPRPIPRCAPPAPPCSPLRTHRWNCASTRCPNSRRATRCCASTAARCAAPTCTCIAASSPVCPTR